MSYIKVVNVIYRFNDFIRNYSYEIILPLLHFRQFFMDNILQCLFNNILFKENISEKNISFDLINNKTIVYFQEVGDIYGLPYSLFDN